jgi:hypothetical protein
MGYANAIKWTYKLVKEYLEKLGYELLSKEYKNCKQKLVLKDQDGYLYCGNLDNIIHRQKTPNKFSKYNPYTIENIKLWLRLNNKPFELISNIYKNNNEKLKWKCLKEECSEIFEMSWNSIFSSGQGCSCCAGMQVGLSNCLATKNPQLASEWHPTLNGDLTPCDVTCGSHKYVWWKCESGHEWFIDIYNRHNGNGCPYCGKKLPSKDYNLLVCNPKLASEWNCEKNEKTPEKYLPNSGKKVWWKCSKCGHEWPAIIESRNVGNGCPKCAESKGEKKIDEILTNYSIPHGSQYTFDALRGIGSGLLRFDVPVFWDEEKTQLRMLIEYDGEQHFKWIEGMMTKKEFEILQHHDKLKDKYCEMYNIKLLRIPYWKFDNIEEILKKELNLNDINLAI